MYKAILTYQICLKPAMEALWNLEDKWKLTTREAALLFTCTALALLGLCAATVIKKKRDRRKQMLEMDHDSVPVKRALMGSVRWCGVNKWGEGERRSPLLGLARYESCVGWQSHNSDSPVWQRPILMGEKCELPRFSGLILYNERGQQLDHSIEDCSPRQNTFQGKSDAVVKTMLKDLLYA